MGLVLNFYVYFPWHISKLISAANLLCHSALINWGCGSIAIGHMLVHVDTLSLRHKLIT